MSTRRNWKYLQKRKQILKRIDQNIFTQPKSIAESMDRMKAVCNDIVQKLFINPEILKIDFFIYRNEW